LRKLFFKIKSKYGQNSKIIFAGDNNINLNKIHPNGERLKNIFLNSGMELLNNDPARITSHSATLIDHIFSNLPIFDVDILTEGIIFSDHECLISTLPFKVIKESTKFYKMQHNLSTKNIEKFKCNIQFETWSSVYDATSVDEKYSNFLKIFKLYYNESFPLQKMCFNSRKPFILPSFLKEEGERIKTFSIFVKHNYSEQDKKFLSSWKKYYEWKIYQAKSKFLSDKIKKSDNVAKTSWSIVNTTLGKSKNKQNSIKVLVENNEEITCPTDIANILNDKFIVPKTNKPVPNLSHIKQNSNSFFLTPTSPYEVEAAICTLSNTGAAGVDSVPCKIMKQVAQFISSPLADIINISFQQGTYPDLMKIAKIIPLYKNKGSKKDSNNYRPISILSCFSKVIGKIFSLRLISFFEKNSLIYQHQHGFVKKRGTATALFEMADRISQAIKEDQQCLGIFYDFSKAFDSISHEMLLEKLKRYGVVGVPLKWIESFLSNRRQKVQIEVVKNGNLIDYVFSDLKDNNTGIGQGSLLGPNFFTIFINDLAFISLLAFIIFYADDSNSLLKEKTTAALYNNAKLSNSCFENWAADHSLQLNSAKTAVVQFHKPRRVLKTSPVLFLDKKALQTSDTTKFLGVTIDETLEYKLQCTDLISKLSSAPFMFVVLRRNINNLSLLKSVYYANVQSHLQFGIICWGESVSFLEVFKIQKKVIRALLGYRYKRTNIPLIPCKDLFISLEILTLPSLFIFECAKFYRKHPNYFSLNSNTHSYNTRRNTDISIPENYKSPKINVASIYNKLPRVIKEIKSYNVFVKKLKKMLVEKCYYCVKDYREEIWQS